MIISAFHNSVVIFFRFFDIHPSNVDYFADQLDCLVQPNYVIHDADNSKKNFQSQSYRTSTGEEESLRVIHAFDELSKQMRNLEGLLLDVVSIQGSLPAFRLTDVRTLSLSHNFYLFSNSSVLASIPFSQAMSAISFGPISFCVSITNFSKSF